MNHSTTSETRFVWLQKEWKHERKHSTSTENLKGDTILQETVHRVSMLAAPHCIHSLDELKRAPWCLELVHEQNEANLKEYILRNYHLFIQSNQCSDVIKNEMSNLQDQTSELMPKLCSTQNNFSSTIGNIETSIGKHNDIQFLLNHHQEVCELNIILAAFLH